jgi:hypothetical protein
MLLPIHPPDCPHCRAGANGAALALYWDADGRCWCCVICGFRGYLGPRVHRPGRGRYAA